MASMVERMLRIADDLLVDICLAAPPLVGEPLARHIMQRFTHSLKLALTSWSEKPTLDHQFILEPTALSRTARFKTRELNSAK